MIFLKKQRQLFIKSILILALIGNVHIAKAQVVAQGACGANGSQVMWKLTTDSVMTITSRDGDDMENFVYEQAVPWYQHRTKIKTLVFVGGLNRIGSSAFIRCTNLESVTIPSTVTRINDWAFEYCSKLKTLILECNGFDVVIGQRAFGICTQLSSIVCKGNYPPDLNVIYLMHSFEDVSGTIPVTVPCGKEFDYIASAWGNKFSNIQEDCSTPFVAVTDITLSTNTVMAGTPLTLTTTVVPNNADNKTIVWSVVNANGTGASINGNTFSAIGQGTASIRASITNGTAVGTNFTKDFNISVTTPGGASIEELESSKLSVSPNPTTGKLTIDNGQLTIENVEVYDIAGKLVQNYRFNSSTKVSLDVSELSNGTYLVSIYSEGQKVTRKFVKE